MIRLALAALLLLQDAIPTGGPIPDVRGFNDKINDPEAVSKITVVVRHVAGQVYVIAGAGGNVLVFAGNDGVMLVDTNFHVFYDQIMAAIRRISDKPVRYVVNTHAHIDHTQNNDNFEREGATVIARPADTQTLRFNGEDVVIVPLKPAHTTSDLAVYIKGSDVWAFGDVYRNDYPSLGESGTTENFLEAYNRALEMTTSNTIFLPGHGQLSRRDDLIALRDVVITVHSRFREMVARGMTLPQILEARPSREFDARFASESLSATTGNTVERWYRGLFDEVSKELAKQP